MLFRRKRQAILTRIANFFWPQKGFARGWLYLMLRILRLRSSDYALAAGVASGVAVSFTPLFGFHFVLAVMLAWLVRGNLIMAMIGTSIGNPWTFPFILVLIHSVGVYFFGLAETEADLSVLSCENLMESPGSALVSIFTVLRASLLGGLIIGSLAGLLVFTIVYRYAGRIRAKFIAISAKRKTQAKEASCD